MPCRSNGVEKVEATGEIPPSEREPKSVDDLVVLLRDHRMGLIQTPQQLRFSWKAIVDWIEKTDPKALTSSSRKRSSDAAETAAEAKQKRFVRILLAREELGAVIDQKPSKQFICSLERKRSKK